MIVRFANVIYWAASSVAVLFLIVAVVVFKNGTDMGMGTLFGVFGVLVWLVGRAVLYVLAGR